MVKLLGIIGRPDVSVCHDAAAAIIEDGRIIAAVEQERLSRRKHAIGEGPCEAVLRCLAQTNLSLNDIDYIAYGWLEDLEHPEEYISDSIVSSRELTPLLLPRDLFHYQEVPPIYFVNHHLCHMASSYYTSGFPKAAGLIVDGKGETTSISLYQAEGTNIQLLDSYSIIYSLGIFYESAAYYSGLGWNSAGKFMGLASYGHPQFAIDFYFDAESGTMHLPIYLQHRLSLDLQAIKDTHEFSRLWVNYFQESFYP